MMVHSLDTYDSSLIARYYRAFPMMKRKSKVRERGRETIKGIIISSMCLQSVYVYCSREFVPILSVLSFLNRLFLSYRFILLSTCHTASKSWCNCWRKNSHNQQILSSFFFLFHYCWNFQLGRRDTRSRNQERIPYHRLVIVGWWEFKRNRQ